MFSAPVSRLSAFLLAALLLAGCTGTNSGSGQNYPSDIAGEPELTAVTTRKSTGTERPWFGTQRADASMVKVRLASPHQAGRFSLVAAGLRDWTITKVEPVAALDLAGTSGGPRDVLVYVHGFNETFEGAALDAARLSDALKFRGDTVLFSWPSRDSVFDYLADRESAIWSRDALEDTLDAMISNPNVGRIHIVAHSMGSMLTVEALRQVHASDRGKMSRFGAIVFASPDIDVDSFSASVRRLGGLHRQMTVITAKDDRALAISASLAGGKRVGRAEKAALQKLGIDVVDASGMGGFLGHDTFLADTGVQKVVIQAIAKARSGTVNAGPSPFPVFQRDLPVTQQPLAAPAAPAPAAVPAAAAPALPPTAGPAAISTPAAVPPPPADRPMAATGPAPASAPAASSLY